MKKQFTVIPVSIVVAALLSLTGCTKPDTIAPVITLNGGNSITIYKGDIFTDPGATANDNKDGDVSSSINVTGSVGTGIGYYTLDYTVTDKSGNFAQATRSVTRKYKASYLAGSYSVTETSPFGTEMYTGTVVAGTTDSSGFVFGCTFNNNPIVVDANITGLNDITPVTVAQGGPLTDFSGTISESSGPVEFTMSYLRPIGSTVTNCTAIWVKQ